MQGLLHTMSAWFASPLSGADLLGLFGHFLVLSVLSIGGAITTAPDMQRYVVGEHHWITQAQFTASVAIAQAAPGPNVLFVTVIGWNVAGPMGAVATTLGILLPSTVLSFAVSRFGARRRDTRGLKAFTTGMTPITIGLLFATGWILAEPYVAGSSPQGGLGAIGLIALTLVVMMRTAWSPMWMVLISAVVGGFGWV